MHDGESVERTLQILRSNHELQLSKTAITALHIKVLPQKVKKEELLTLSGKGKNICVLILIEINGFIAIHVCSSWQS